MSVNPYAPPKTEVADRPKSALSPWKAVLVGLTIDVGGSLLLAVVLGAVYSGFRFSAGAGRVHVRAEMASMLPTSWLSILGSVAGAAALSFLGGMVCTRLARRSDYSLGLVLASISASFGLLLSFNQYSVAMNLVMTSVTFAFVLLGTRYGQVRGRV